MRKKRGSIKEEKPLKAIIFGDSFSKEFRPITLEKPRILLPLNNVPLIDYVLELLVCSGVKEIYIFCKENHDLILDYINKSNWKKRSIEDEIIIDCFFVKNAKNVGDFLRSIENFPDIRINSDFIIINGDVISNIDLKPIIINHRNERKKKNSSLLMTSVFIQESDFVERLDYLENDKHKVVIGLGIKQGQYDQLICYKNKKKENFDIPFQKFREFDHIEIRSHLIDSHIDICSPTVLGLFKENFDFADMRNDLMKNVLTDEVVSEGNKIYPYILKKGYARRVSSIRAYEVVSRDATKRWLYPLVPDSNFNGLTCYTIKKGNNYFEKGVDLSRSTIINKNNIVGRGTVIGDGSNISDSCVGRGVIIGKNVIIEKSFIWDDSVIEDNVKIYNSLITNNVTVKKGAILELGCILTNSVVIGEDFVVKKHSRVTIRGDDLKEDNNVDVDSIRKIKVLLDEVGEDGKGRIYKGFTSRMEYNYLGLTDAELYTEEEEEDHNSDISEAEVVEETEDSYETFKNEIAEIVKKAIDKYYPKQEILFEVNSRKFAHDYSLLETGYAVLLGLLKSGDNIEGDVSPEELIETFSSLIQNKEKVGVNWIEIFDHFSQDEKDREIFVLNSLVDFCLHEGKKFGEFFDSIVNQLHESHIITDKILVQWTEDKNKSDDVEVKNFCDKLKDLVEWIKENEEEEEGEEEEDELEEEGEEDDEEGEDEDDLEEDDEEDDLEEDDEEEDDLEEEDEEEKE